MELEIQPDAEAVARRAAELIAAEARLAQQARGRFLLAVSGGRTPWRMLRLLADEDVPWSAVHLFQVDERVAPPNDPDRNLAHIGSSLATTPLPPEQMHAMPVGDPNLEAAAARYAQTLCDVAGTPPVLDLVHLGLGSDGHTASLVPGDPVLLENNADVALAGPYQGRRRMTLTYPILNRARRVLFVVTGAEKANALRRLRAGDTTIPAGRIRLNDATVVADRAAAERELE